MEFYYLSGSPFSWKVWLALEHKRLDYELKILSADAGDLKSPPFLALNPRGKVPVIVDNGYVLTESSAIIEYLEERYAASGAPLWPADSQARGKARRIAIEGDGFTYPNVRKLVVELLMRKTGEPDTAVLGAAKLALAAEFAALEKLIAGPYLLGTVPTAADFTIYPFLAVFNRVRALKPEYDVGDVPGTLKRWMQNVEALPYFGKTTPPHWKVS